MSFSLSLRGRRLLRAVAVATTLVGGLAGITAAVAPTAAAATCSNINVVVARGTFEPGTLGTIVGDPVFAALQKAITSQTLDSYAVNYPANLNEPSSVQAGNTDLVNHVNSQASACPNQRFILVGYSQGANVVDNSIGISSAGALVGGAIVATIPSSLNSKIVAILQFGNPIRAQGKSITGTFAARTDDFCASQDPVCQAGGNDPEAHLSYGSDATAAAQFAAGLV